MALHGKHAKDPRQVQVGKHGVSTRSGISVPKVAVSALIVCAVALVPFSIAASHSVIESQAFADPARTAFSALSDTSRQADEADAPTKRADFTSHVAAKMQNAIMSGGCELVSLSIALESMGLAVDPHDFVSAYLEVDGHFATGYSGSPYSKGAGYPPGIVAAANRYLTSTGSVMRAHDLTGTSLEELEDTLVDKGYPVLVWTTMGFKDPEFAGAFDNGREWYSNEHCVVLYGHEKDQLLVSDPLEGLVKRDASRFADIYNQCGSMALAIY